ncbi:MAG: BrnT family toxin [Reyranella sp.]|uniref:BrnT family toxin n=1 Tax=Reyranella sp. TaxID=1929291 RepID=UPI0011FE1853|nr:BrnT family toxin [Reyranella sp.]TAJ41743.1 MAG: BrnT family toxin [Reyranella sp.]
MDFEWDPEKSEATLNNRGFDFRFASFVFLDPFRLEREDLRRNYGERRYQTIGEIDGQTYFVVFTKRGRRTRIISARRAHDNEDRAYRARQA